MNKPNVIVFSLAVIGFIGVVIFLIFGKEISPSFEPSVFRLTYQFFLLAVLGGALSFLFKELSREKQLRRFNDERLREIHSDLLTAFNQAKTVRRILRAFVYFADEGGESVLREDYDGQMRELNTAQLVFETYSKRAKYNELWFEEAKDLPKNLEAIESYLNAILGEYQERRKRFDGDPPSYPLSELPMLKEFVGPDDEWQLFDKMFKTPMRETLQSLDEARVG